MRSNNARKVLLKPTGLSQLTVHSKVQSYIVEFIKQVLRKQTPGTYPRLSGNPFIFDAIGILGYLGYVMLQGSVGMFFDKWLSNGDPVSQV